MSKISTNEQYKLFELFERLLQGDVTPEASSLMKNSNFVTALIVYFFGNLIVSGLSEEDRKKFINAILCGEIGKLSITDRKKYQEILVAINKPDRLQPLVTVMNSVKGEDDMRKLIGILRETCQGNPGLDVLIRTAIGKLGGKVNSTNKGNDKKPETKIIEKTYMDPSQVKFYEEEYNKIKGKDFNVSLQKCGYDYVVMNFAVRDDNDSGFNRFIALKILIDFICSGGRFLDLCSSQDIPLSPIPNKNFQEIWHNIYGVQVELENFMNDLNKVIEKDNDIDEKLNQLLQCKDNLGKNDMTSRIKACFVADAIRLLDIIEARTDELKIRSQKLMWDTCISIKNSIYWDIHTCVFCFFGNLINALIVKRCQCKDVEVNLSDYDRRTNVVFACKKNPAIAAGDRFSETEEEDKHKVEDSFKK